jgi:hypothetical protein
MQGEMVSINWQRTSKTISKACITDNSEIFLRGTICIVDEKIT